MKQGSRMLVMLAAGVVLLMAATLAADVVLSNNAIRVVGPPTAWSGEVFYSEMTGAYPSAAAIRGYAPVTGTAVYGSAAGGIGVYGSSSSNAGVRGSSSSGWGGLFTSSGGYGLYAISAGVEHTDHGVYGSANNGYGVYGKSTNNDGVRGEGGQAGVRGIGNNQGVSGTSTSGTGVYGYSSNGYGVYGSSTNLDGVYGYSSTSYGGYFYSSSFRGIYSSSASAYYAGYFWNRGGSTHPGIYVNGTMVVTGPKSGYVVDLARNDGSDPLQVGDVVVITGATDPVLGEIPVPTVRLTDASASTAVLGVVDRMFATPADAEAIPEDMFEAWHELVSTISSGVGAESAAAGYGDEFSDKKTTETPLRPSMESPGRFVSRAEAEFFAVVRGADPGIAPGAYLGVVTLGSFKAIRVDASYGSILPGDLLVSSPTPGHAMRALDPEPGTIIGKALGRLEDGQGTIPVLITLN